jgi:ribosomal protein S6--L-glutamate ligase
MELVSFDALRTVHLPGVTYIKPEQYLRHRDLLARADWLLFPAYWQVDPLVYGLRARIFPSIASYHLGHDKIAMTRAFELACPAHVPLTLIEANSDDGRDRILDTLPFPFVAKTARSAEGRGVFLIETQSDWRAYCATHAVLYAQELLPARRDLRLALVGDQVIGGYWREHRDGGFHNNVAQGGQIVHGALPAAAVELVQNLARMLGIDHAGFDLMACDGHFYLLEFNRLFGNQGLTEQGIEPGAFIHRYLQGGRGQF